MPDIGQAVPLLSLLHLCDSLFPIGGFAHSDGLETATASGSVATGDDLHRWMDTCLFEMLGPCEARAVAAAWTAVRCGDIGSLRGLDDEVHALRPSLAA